MVLVMTLLTECCPDSCLAGQHLPSQSDGDSRLRRRSPVSGEAKEGGANRDPRCRPALKQIPSGGVGTKGEGVTEWRQVVLVEWFMGAGPIFLVFTFVTSDMSNIVFHAALTILTRVSYVLQRGRGLSPWKQFYFPPGKT